MKKLEFLVLIGTLSCAILVNFISLVDKCQFNSEVIILESCDLEVALDSCWVWWEETACQTKDVTMLAINKNNVNPGEYIQIKFDFSGGHGTNLALGEFNVYEAAILWSSDMLKTYDGQDVNLVVEITSMTESHNGLETAVEGNIKGFLTNEQGELEKVNFRFDQVI